MLYNVLEELRAENIDFEYTGNEEWVSIRCQFHEDKNPSCGIRVEDGYFACKGCDAKGSFVKLLAKVKGTNFDTIKLYLADKYSQSIADKPIMPEVYEGYHAKIDEALPLKKELYKRGVTDDLIRQYRLGVDRGKITIPITNDGGHVVNVMRYAPGAPVKKFTSMSGRGKPARLYPVEQLKYPRILLCGGMLKAVAATTELNKHNIGAISCTGGEQAKNWPAAMLKRIAKDKEWVGICMDVDKVGVKAAQDLALRMYHLVPITAIVSLPLDMDRYPKGDISDWIGAEGKEVMPLIEEAQPFVPKLKQQQTTGPPEDANIEDVRDGCNIDKRLKFRAMVSANGQEQYFLPQEVTVKCNREQDFCFICPIMALPQEKDDTCTALIEPEEAHLLGMMEARSTIMPEKYKAALGVPPCKAVSFRPKSVYTVENVLLTQDVEDNSIEDIVSVAAVTINCKVKPKETYDFTGRVVSHPETQRATSILSEKEAVADTLSQYVPNPDLMKRFQPDEWTADGIERRLTSIYEEFEGYVTKIYKRQDLHFLLDLAWHSVLHFKIGNRMVKGWVEVLAVGDSSQGKTDTSYYLMKHYGLGQRVDCKGATAAGLLGGLQQVNKQWFASWGIIPANDRKLVILEELKGLDPESLSKLTDMRSSGIAEIPKIEQAKTNARTRLVAVSNTKSGKDVGSYAFGVSMLTELIPNMEDIRRFDAFMVLSKDDVSIDLMQKMSGRITNGDASCTYTPEACRNLVLWGWTRTPDEVHFEDWQHLVDVVHGLCSDFTDAVPIIDRGGMRFKMARLAAASAVRTYSNQGSDVLVRKCHVEHIDRFLRRIYTAPHFAYDRFTTAEKERNTLANEDVLKTTIQKLSNPDMFAKLLQFKGSFDKTDLADFSGIGDQEELGTFISLLVKNRAIYREKGQYHKNVQFTKMLTELLHGGVLPSKVTPRHEKQGL